MLTAYDLYIVWSYHLAYLVFQAALYLKIKDLLDLSCETVADKIKGMTPEQILRYQDLKSDMTPQEKEEYLRMSF